MEKVIKSINDDVINLSMVGIFYNDDNENAKKTAEDLSALLKEKDVESQVLTTDKYSKDITCAIVLGGDGTILKTARFYAKYQVLNRRLRYRKTGQNIFLYPRFVYE